MQVLINRHVLAHESKVKFGCKLKTLPGFNKEVSSSSQDMLQARKCRHLSRVSLHVPGLDREQF